MTRTVALVGLLAALAVVLLGVPALAQDGSLVVDAPTADTLRTAAGIAIVVALITNLLRGVVPPPVFDKWGPTIAVVVGVGLALLGLFVAPDTTPTGDAIVTAILAGAFGGFMSQNVNTMVQRALRPTG